MQEIWKEVDIDPEQLLKTPAEMEAEQAREDELTAMQNPQEQPPDPRLAELDVAEREGMAEAARGKAAGHWQDARRRAALADQAEEGIEMARAKTKAVAARSAGNGNGNGGMKRG